MTTVRAPDTREDGERHDAAEQQPSEDAQEPHGTNTAAEVLHGKVPCQTVPGALVSL